MKNALLLFLFVLYMPCYAQNSCMKFRVDLYIKPNVLLDNSTVTRFQLEYIYCGKIWFYNCGTDHIVVNKNIILANNYNERNDITQSYKSPIFARIYRKENGTYKFNTQENIEVFNREMPAPDNYYLQPNQEVSVLTGGRYFTFLVPGEYEVKFDYINRIDTEQTKYRLYPGMEAGCFRDYSYFLDNGFFFQTSSNTIHFTVADNK